MASIDNELEYIIVNITRDHDTDTLDEVMDVYVSQIKQVALAAILEKKVILKTETGTLQQRNDYIEAVPVESLKELFS